MVTEHSNIEPRLQTGCAQPYVAIAIKVTTAHWNDTCKLVPELTNWLDHKAIKITGPLFYRYHTLGNNVTPYELEIGFPIADDVEGDGHVISGNIPPGTFATLIHCGGREGLNGSYAMLQQWAQQQGIKWEKQGDQWAGRFEFCLDHPAFGHVSGHKRIAIAMLIDE
jgi:effector-binding domain-containing protein